MSETMTTTSHKAAALTAASALALYDAAESTADKVRAAAAMAVVLRAKLPKPKAAKAAADLLTAENLIVTMKRVCMIVSRKATIPILSHVLLEAKKGMLRVYATDLDMMYVETIRAPDCPDFRLTAPAHDLAGALRGCSGDVVFEPEVGGLYLRMTAGGMTTRLPCLEAKDFPIMDVPQRPDREKFVAAGAAAKAEIETQWLLEPLQFVRPAVSAEETRYYLNGVYMHVVVQEGVEKLAFVATDGSRMLIDYGEHAAGLGRNMPGVILPRAAVDWMLRNIRDDEAQVDVWESQMRVTTVTGTFQFKLIDGNFPDYWRVVPRDQGKTVLGLADCKAAAESFDRVLSQKAKDKAAAVTLDLTAPDKAIVQVRTSDGGGASVALADVAVIGRPCEAHFNGRILKEMIALGGTGEMSLSLGGPNDPARLDWPTFPGRTGIIMPLRV